MEWMWRAGGAARIGLGPLVFSTVLLGCDAGYPSSSWEDEAYDHAALSGGFELVGTHAGKPCTTCHDPVSYEPIFRPDDSNDCYACHTEDYQEEHGAEGYPKLCTLCHTPTDWSDGEFDHRELSGGFELLLVHGELPCTACHDPETFDPLFDPVDEYDCVACHQPAFPATHADRGYPSACTFCHTPTAWADGMFDHPALSGGFELLGTHTGLKCLFCHDPATFEVPENPDDAQDCVACHLDRYEGVHAGTGYPTTCADCHTPTFWRDGEFNHLGISGGFDLLGTHAELPCLACHDADSFEPLFNPQDANDCVTCHQEDYDTRHAGSGYPLTCTSCHTPTSWTGGSFDHQVASGGFDLVGTHGDLECVKCHSPGDFAPLFDPQDETDCLACHQDDYDAQHGGQGYPTDCTACHTPTLWSDGTFDHAVASGGYVLQGVHAGAPCVSCHDPDTFAPRFDPSDETDCVACHQADYDAQHAGSGYPLTCTSCHTPTAWTGGTFDHAAASGGYVLEGVHDGAPCVSCHYPDTFAPRFDPSDETDCVACHQAEYDAQHLADGYPRTCVSCHTPTAWENADFDHDRDYFPIFTGGHAPRWSGCATCHTNPDDFSEFTCFTCHAHNQVTMDNRHAGRDGYSYSPPACVGCHPDGTADD